MKLAGTGAAMADRAARGGLGGPSPQRGRDCSSCGGFDPQCSQRARLTGIRLAVGRPTARRRVALWRDGGPIRQGVKWVLLHPKDNGAEVAATMKSTAQIPTESTVPRLAHVNPSPRLPGSEAQPGPTLDRFAKRLRRVQLGSHRLKMAALALCPYGQCWSDVLTEIQINIKRSALAAEWECRLATVDDVLRDLARVGILGRKRSRGHIRLTLFDRIQNPESDRIPITLELPRVIGFRSLWKLPRVIGFRGHPNRTYNTAAAAAGWGVVRRRAASRAEARTAADPEATAGHRQHGAGAARGCADRRDASRCRRGVPGAQAQGFDPPGQVIQRRIRGPTGISRLRRTASRATAAGRRR